MRVFLYEYTCAAVGPNSAVPSLRAEGRAMLAAVARDFTRIPGVEALTLLHADFPSELSFSGCRCVRSRDEARSFRELARHADYALVIAPESDDFLLTRCRWVVGAGGRLLGPSPAAVCLTGDKLALARDLSGHGIPTPATYLSQDRALGAVGFPWVLKPRYGVGSQATFLVRDADTWTACAASAGAEAPCAEMIVQPFVPGLPASVALLVGPRAVISLLPTAQHLSADGRFRYLGGSLPLPADLASRAETLARRALPTIPGLHGYVGVDLVLGAAEDGSADSVIEINPRLTTSYIGLRALAETNLARVMLQTARGEDPLGITWRQCVVQFFADGTVAPAVAAW